MYLIWVKYNINNCYFHKDTKFKNIHILQNLKFLQNSLNYCSNQIKSINNFSIL